MTDAEKRTVINTLIDKLESKKNDAQKNTTINLTATKTKENAGKWYFYNPEVVKTGILEFQKKWGNRSLADNWKLNKYAGLTAELFVPPRRAPDARLRPPRSCWWVRYNRNG